MSLNNFIIVTLGLAVALLFPIGRIDAACNVCSNFGIACVNQTAFNLCQAGTPNTDRVYNCPSGRECSDLAEKCVEPTAGGTPTCDSNIRGCGVCDGNKLFVCTSRTTFVQCNGRERTNITGSCSGGFVCDSQSGELCKNECNRPAVLECDIDAPL